MFPVVLVQEEREDYKFRLMSHAVILILTAKKFPAAHFCSDLF